MLKKGTNCSSLDGALKHGVAMALKHGVEARRCHVLESPTIIGVIMSLEYYTLWTRPVGDTDPALVVVRRRARVCVETWGAWR